MVFNWLPYIIQLLSGSVRTTRLVVGLIYNNLGVFEILNDFFFKFIYIFGVILRVVYVLNFLRFDLQFIWWDLLTDFKISWSIEFLRPLDEISPKDSLFCCGRLCRLACIEIHRFLNKVAPEHIVFLGLEGFCILILLRIDVLFDHALNLFELQTGWCELFFQFCDPFFHLVQFIICLF